MPNTQATYQHTREQRLLETAAKGELLVLGTRQQLPTRTGATVLIPPSVEGSLCLQLQANLSFMASHE